MTAYSELKWPRRLARPDYFLLADNSGVFDLLALIDILESASVHNKRGMCGLAFVAALLTICWLLAPLAKAQVATSGHRNQQETGVIRSGRS